MNKKIIFVSFFSLLLAACETVPKAPPVPYSDLSVDKARVYFSTVSYKLSSETMSGSDVFAALFSGGGVLGQENMMFLQKTDDNLDPLAKVAKDAGYYIDVVPGEYRFVSGGIPGRSYFWLIGRFAQEIKLDLRAGDIKTLLLGVTENLSSKEYGIADIQLSSEEISKCMATRNSGDNKANRAVYKEVTQIGEVDGKPLHDRRKSSVCYQLGKALPVPPKTDSLKKLFEQRKDRYMESLGATQ